ncbi:helix-turn-helix domain-containing protein [Paenibacillus sp. PAMC21692]|uniref:response regulator transcription factor n=1 Tax=Paenibacillus sp. PAMC21692 TaxID=2762320 RepID=UPI00164D1D28|nr:helix-turn-helix domain-containing protein [Paenibacillus sp. PAMC21692]QNK60280.1 helix-turn-helix domain-containing protein [Paenibacillus sp. PAMC21692]
MFKAVIVDDERWIVEGIKAGVRWEKFGFQVTGTAENGKEGLELIELLRPDFVLTDIKMPLVNGLELIKRGKDISPHTIFAVLSGHAEFAYAQKALNYGTFGYCLKPFEIEEIESMLAKLSETLKQRKEPEPESDAQDLYEVICSGNEHLLAEKLLSVDMPVSADMPITPIVIQGYMSERYLETIPHIRFRMNKRRVAILIHSHLTERFLGSLDLSGNEIEYSIGIGLPTTSHTELDSSLEAASVAAYGSFSTGNGGVYRPVQNPDSTIDNLLSELAGALAQKDRIRFVSIMESAKPLFHNYMLTIKDAYLIYNTVMYLFTREGVKERARFLEGYDQLYYDYGHANAMVDYLVKHTLQSLSDELSSRLAGVSHNRIKEVLTYIHHHFNQEMSIRSLSEKFYLSPTYLSQLFKKEVGENFVEYLSRQRIQYACKLLAETDMTVSQIGEQCGFNDYFYFTRIFKRLNGMTPTQYREAR